MDPFVIIFGINLAKNRFCFPGMGKNFQDWGFIPGQTRG
jgi:hypothetical protein